MFCNKRKVLKASDLNQNTPKEYLVDTHKNLSIDYLLIVT